MKLVCDLTATSRPIRPRSALPPPALRLDFVNGVYTPGGFGSVITFSRASTATYFDASGTLQTADADQPRIDHDPVTLARRGLLIEAARTNLFLNSATPASQSITVTAQDYALSFRGTGSITLSGAHAAVLSGTGANQRVDLVFTPAAGTLTLTLSGSVSEPQLEAGNCATSHIVTAGVAMTRARDQVSVTLGAWWNPDAGTLLAEWVDINQQSGNTRIVGLSGAPAAVILAGQTGDNGGLRVRTFNGSTTVDSQIAGDISKGIRRGVVGYSAAGRVVGVAGVLTTGPGEFASPAPTALFLGQASNGAGVMNGCLRSLTYHPVRLSDGQMLALVP
jgi:hypothetical protein